MSQLACFDTALQTGFCTVHLLLAALMVMLMMMLMMMLMVIMVMIIHTLTLTLNNTKGGEVNQTHHKETTFDEK